jgi:hypothetical protein
VRAQWIGHVELGPDLHAADQSGPGSFRQPHDLAQHAVDPVTHDNRAFRRLGVDVARALADGIVDHCIHELRDGPVELPIGLGGRGARVQRDDGGLGETDEQALDRALRPVELIESSGDRLWSAHLEPDVATGDEAEGLLHVQIARVGRRDLNDPIVG